MQKSTQQIVLEFRKLQQTLERKYAPKIRQALQAAYNEGANMLVRFGAQGASTYLRGLKAPGLEAALRGLMREAYLRGAWQVYRDLNSEKAAIFGSGFSELMKAFLDAYLNRWLAITLARINATTIQQLQNIISKGNQEGLSVQDIAKGIRETGEPAKRSITIARTESVSALNAGKIDGAKQSRWASNKEWSSAKDKRTRRIPRDQADHLHMDGQTVDLYAKFIENTKQGIIAMDAPGDKNAPASSIVNCRCVVIIKPKRDANGRLVPNQGAQRNNVYVGSVVAPRVIPLIQRTRN